MPDDDAVVEAVARAIGLVNADADWKYYQPEALAAIAAYRDAVAGGGEEG